MAENRIVEDALKLIEGRINLENSKHYYLIRTDQGRNYDQFAQSNYVALNYTNHPIEYLRQIVREYPTPDVRVQKIKEKLLDMHRQGTINLASRNGEEMEGSTLTRTAKQIYIVTYGIKQGDIVIIPDKDSHRIRIGRVTDEHLAMDIADFSYARHVEWIKEIPKSRLDPCLYKALGANQAVCDITKYAEYIERNYTSYFSVADTYYYVLTVNTSNVSAWDLTESISELLKIAQKFSDENNLNLDLRSSVNFSINLNSPGKFSFASSMAVAVLIMASATALFGGDIKYDQFNASTDGAFKTIVDCIIEYRQQDQELRHMDELFQRCSNSLELKSVEDINNAVDEEENEAEPELDENQIEDVHSEL